MARLKGQVDSKWRSSLISDGGVAALMALSGVDGGFAAVVALVPLDSFLVSAIPHPFRGQRFLVCLLSGLHLALSRDVNSLFVFGGDSLGVFDDGVSALFLCFLLLLFGELVDDVRLERVPTLELDLLVCINGVDLDHFGHFQPFSVASDVVGDEQLFSSLLDVPKLLSAVMEHVDISLGGVKLEHLLQRAEELVPVVVVGLHAGDVGGEFMFAVSDGDVSVPNDTDVLGDLSEGAE